MRISIGRLIEWGGATLGGLLFLLGVLHFPESGKVLDVSDALTDIYQRWIDIVGILFIPFQELIYWPFGVSEVSDYEKKVAGLFLSLLAAPSAKMIYLTLKNPPAIRSGKIGKLYQAISAFFTVVASAYIFDDTDFSIFVILLFLFSLIVIFIVYYQDKSIRLYIDKQAHNFNRIKNGGDQTNLVLVYLTTPVVSILWLVGLSAPALWIADGAPIQW